MYNKKNGGKKQLNLFKILSTDNNKHSMNWWEMSNQISCISCKTVNNVNENNSSFLCVEYGEEQIVADTCCDEPSSNKRFAIRINELETECPTCKSEMIKLPCCDNSDKSQSLMIIFTIAKFVKSILLVVCVK